VKRVKWATQELAREQKTSSRLFVIDAGTDHGELRAKYADRSRYIIARGQIRIAVTDRAGEPPRFSGIVQGVAIESVTVPLEYRSVLDPLVPGGPSPGLDTSPRYVVTLHVGRRLEPWIAGIRGI
jgi:hypothetical protein